MILGGSCSSSASDPQLSRRLIIVGPAWIQSSRVLQRKVTITSAMTGYKKRTFFKKPTEIYYFQALLFSTF